MDKNNNLNQKIYAEYANIVDNNWRLNEVIIDKFSNEVNVESTRETHSDFSIYSEYNYEKINSLFKNFDTMSFLDLILNYQDLQDRGYDKSYLDQNLNAMLSLPFFLFIMTALAAILTMNTLKNLIILHL